MQGRTAGGSDVPDISCSNRHTFGTTGGQDVYVTPGGKEVTSSHLLTFTRQKKKKKKRVAGDREQGVWCTEVTLLTPGPVCHRWTVYACGRSTAASTSCLLRHSSSTHIST